MDNRITIKVNGDITLSQNKNGLTFGTDALLLSAFTKRNKFSISNKIAADLGSGTGIMPLLCAKSGKFSKIYAVEIQSEFAKLIEENAKQNNLGDKIIPILSDIRDLKSTTLGCEVDVVFSNPPYMKESAGKRNIHDEKYIARHEVCGDIGDFCACASRILKHGGKFLCVWRPDRLEDLLYSMREHKLEPKLMVFVHAHPKAEPSMVLVETIKGGASGMRISRPLFLSDSLEDNINNVPSIDAKTIYDSSSFEHFLQN